MGNNQELVTMTPEDLHFHPRNMRRFYPKDQVQEMADSILAKKGVLQPLIITELDSKWVVVDGNMRLAAGRLLGKKCPPLLCRKVDQKAADQLLDMVVANNIRYDVDPMSEGLHYKALMEEGLTVKEISQKTGIYELRVYNRMALTELEEPIQKLVAEGKIPSHPDLVRALMTLTPSARQAMVMRMARSPDLTVKSVVNTCIKMTTAKTDVRFKHPATTLAGVRFRKDGKVVHLRRGAKNACGKCNKYETVKAMVAEPAWSLLVHNADGVCDGCDMRILQKECGKCPMVQMLKSLAGKPHG